MGSGWVQAGLRRGFRGSGVGDSVGVFRCLVGVFRCFSVFLLCFSVFLDPGSYPGSRAVQGCSRRRLAAISKSYNPIEAHIKPI